MKATVEIEKLFEEIAPKICHMAWVSYQMGAGQKYNLYPDKADLESHADAIKAFKENPRITASANHDNWCQYKIDNGWKYGCVKDKKKKTHPDLIPFDQLPKVEQMKDVNDLEARKFAYRLAVDISDFYYQAMVECLKSYNEKKRSK